MESYGGSLDLPLLKSMKGKSDQGIESEERTKTHLNVHLVSAQHNGDVFADTLEITMPIGNVLVCDARRNVKHDNATLALDVITITETTEFFLSSSIPDIEDDIAEIGGEGQGVDFNTKSGCVIVASV